MAIAGDHRGYLDEIDVSWGDGPLGQGPTGRCLRTGQTQVQVDFVNDPDYRPWRDIAERHGFRCSISLAVFANGRIDGALMVYAAEAGAFDTLARDLLEDLAADLGYGIERLRDLESLVHATREAQEQGERLQATLDSLFDPLVLMTAVRDEDGSLTDLRYVEANAAAAAYNGVPREQMVGDTMLGLFPGLRDNGPLERYFEVIETGIPLVLDDDPYVNDLTGQPRRYDIRAAKSGDGLALTWRDVTDRYAAAQQLAESERRYRLVAENSSDVVLLADGLMNLSWVSPSAEHAFGLASDQLLGHSAAEFIHPDDLPELQLAVERSDALGEPLRVRYRWRHADGAYGWVEAIGQPVVDDGSGKAGRVVGLRDIQAQVLAEQELVAREERYRLLAENASDIVWQVAPDGTLTWVSPSVTGVLGWEPDHLLGRVALDLVHPDDTARLVVARNDVLSGNSAQGEFRIRCADTSFRWMSVTIHPVPTADGVARVAALRDIQDEMAARTELEYTLGHDQVTGLATRRVMLTRVAFLEERLSATTPALGLLCIGIDSLATINAALTYAAGDLVLTTIATRIAAVARHPDLVGRGSGDEFLMLLPNLTSAADAVAIAEQVRLAVHGTVTVAGQPILPTVSVGISTGDRDSEPEQLLRDAGLALRQAKNNGRDRCEFADPHLVEEAQQRIALEAGIRDGLRDGQFVPWFQPIMSFDTGRLAGYEALVRWVRDDTVIEPAGFLPVAEQSTLVHDMDIAVLRQAVTALAGLPAPIYLAVNASTSTLTRTPYADIVIAALDEAGIDPARLHLEVTETALLALTDPIVAAIEALARVGVKWYVDDFGTGYSSISHLRDLPVSGLKLDRSFTAGMGAGDDTCLRLADALVGLARGLKLDTVAEGVETDIEAALLRGQGWQHGQGWLYGKAQPLPRT